MLPFIGYNAGDYLQHWLNIGESTPAAKLPKVFLVNWFRRDTNGKFIWPGFGENSRVLKWAIDRIEGTATSTETPIGHVPAPGSLDTTGLDVTDSDLATAMAVDPDEWLAEVADIDTWFARFEDALPVELANQLDQLKGRVS